MQTLSPELLTAQQATGQKPYAQAVAYYESMSFTPAVETPFYPPTGSTIIDADSCRVHPSSGNDAIVTAYLCIDGSGNITLYYRCANDIINWSIAPAGLPVEGTVSGGSWSNSYTPMAVSVTSDWTQNTSSSTIMFSVEYCKTVVNSGHNNVQFNVWYGVFTVSSQGVLAAVTSGTLTHTTVLATTNVSLPVQGYGGICGVYDSLASTGLIIFSDFAFNNGMQSSGNFGKGDWVLRYYTLTATALGSTNTPYILPAKLYSQVNNLQLIEQNGIYYGAICGFSSEGLQQVKTFELLSGQYIEKPFSVSGQQDVSNANRGIVYGPVYMGLSLVDMPVDMSQYPSTSQVFCLTYGYSAYGASFTNMLFSLDFNHWGTKKMIDALSARQAKLLDATPNYVLLLDSNQGASYYTRSVTSYDVSSDILSFTMQDEPDGSPSTLSLSLANNGYIGANVTKPAVIQKDAMIKVSLGYNISLGRGTGDTNYLSFNGTSSSVTIPVTNGSALQLQYPLTLSAWVYLGTGSAGTYTAILNQSTAENYELDYDVANKQFRFTIKTASGWETRGTGNNSVVTGQWYHLCGTVDGSNMFLYLNGVQKDRGSVLTLQVLKDTGNLTIGSRPQPDRYFKGYIDDVRMYNTAFSFSDVTKLYTGSTSMLTNLVAWWKFDEGSGTIANDSSGNGFTGTIANAAYGAFVQTEAIQHGIYYIDTITQTTDIKTNDLQLDCRDAFKKLASASYLYQLTLLSQYRYGFNNTSQDFNSNWSKLF